MVARTNDLPRSAPNATTPVASDLAAIALEAVAVPPPSGDLHHIHISFCSDDVAADRWNDFCSSCCDTRDSNITEQYSSGQQATHLADRLLRIEIFTRSVAMRTVLLAVLGATSIAALQPAPAFATPDTVKRYWEARHYGSVSKLQDAGKIGQQPRTNSADTSTPASTSRTHQNAADTRVAH